MDRRSQENRKLIEGRNSFKPTPLFHLPTRVPETKFKWDYNVLHVKKLVLHEDSLIEFVDENGTKNKNSDEMNKKIEEHSCQLTTYIDEEVKKLQECLNDLSQDYKVEKEVSSALSHSLNKQKIDHENKIKTLETKLSALEDDISDIEDDLHAKFIKSNNTFDEKLKILLEDLEKLHEEFLKEKNKPPIAPPAPVTRQESKVERVIVQKIIDEERTPTVLKLKTNKTQRASSYAFDVMWRDDLSDTINVGNFDIEIPERSKIRVPNKGLYRIRVIVGFQQQIDESTPSTGWIFPSLSIDINGSSVEKREQDWLGMGVEKDVHTDSFTLETICHLTPEDFISIQMSNKCTNGESTLVTLPSQCSLIIEKK